MQKRKNLKKKEKIKGDGKSILCNTKLCVEANL